MVIDGNAISNNESIKALVEIEKSFVINIYNALFIHQHKPIFIFQLRSNINIINCTIVDSKFNFIAELIVVSSSQIKILNCTLKNVIFNKTSLITSFQSLTEMININIYSSCFLDCSLINNVDGTFSLNKFAIANSTGYISNIFDSVGTVHFMVENFSLYNLTFHQNKLCTSFIFYSDFASELIIRNLSISYCKGIDLFNGICKIFDLNYGFIYESFFYNEYVIKVAKSSVTSIMNTIIQNCVCRSIIIINSCSSFIFFNSTINNISNVAFNILDSQKQNSMRKMPPLFYLSEVSTHILVNTTNFLNIYNQNAPIFFIHKSLAFFTNVIFKNIQLDYYSCCIISDESSKLLIIHSKFPHPNGAISNVVCSPVYAEGDFYIQDASIVSKKKKMVFDCQNIKLNDENKYYNQLIFISLLAFMIILLSFLIKMILCNIDIHLNQYELLPSN